MKGETRAHQRYQIRISAEIIFKEGGSFTCTTRDLSIGGVGVDMERPLAEGADISVELFVVVDDVEDEGTMPLAVDGRVVWCRMKAPREFLAGIKFVGITAEQRTYLQKLISASAISAEAL